MFEQIDGQCYKNLIDYGVRNLTKHCSELNSLNVFPVPDGDTGTNMVTTISKGFYALDEKDAELSDVSRKFARAIIFEARGNSGVILSQFLKGVSETFENVQRADANLFIKALEHGSACARSAVANPVEGTMLTVISDATAAVRDNMQKLDIKSVDEIVSVFVKHARESLDNTPELLPALKAAGVVDSGGAGIVCLFEGMKSFFEGKELDATPKTENEKTVDYSAFNKDSVFEYGYCTELVLQTLSSKEPFEYNSFKKGLAELGDSIVTTFTDNKVKLHIHTKSPETVFSYCHAYGEFLTVKIENMTVGHTESVKNIICANNKSENAFSVVAVAYDRSVQRLLIEMGADVVIYSDDAASTKEYLDAFENVQTEHILVFPNSSDSIMSALQAKKLYKNSKVHVINTKSITECYASLPTIEFENEDVGAVVDDITETVSSLYTMTVVRRKESIGFDGAIIGRNDYYAFSGKEIISVGKSLVGTVVSAICKTLEEKQKEIITIFHDSSISQNQLDDIITAVEGLGQCVEIFTVATESMPLTVSFE